MILETTPCAGATLRYFGVNGPTWNNRTKKNVFRDTLRRHGFAVRSRKSKLGSIKTIGAARARIAQMAKDEPQVLAFMVTVKRHVLVIDTNGETVVDTSPRIKDKRQIEAIDAVFIKQSKEG